ncbi:MAG: hypothetical protein HAW66_07005 [Shewanella sp.]|nr:hypothetical protein [Shewanella sp.]
MIDKKKGLVNFSIDNPPASKNSDDKYQEEYSLDIHSFLEQSTDDNAEETTYSNKSIKKAGRNLRKKEGDLKQATYLIQLFRAAHEKPLNTVSYLIGRCCRELQIPVKPVKRLKRLETIVGKLQRSTLDGTNTNKTCITNMNDIGGCRAIFPDLQSLEKAKEHLTKTIESQHRICIKDIDDYIHSPKERDCGYRSLHIIYQYEHTSGKKFKVEAQLRTRLQHLWATTVEIVDIVERTKIKTHSYIPDDQKSTKQKSWESLLSIMSTFIAVQEGTMSLSSSEKSHYSQQLRQLDSELCAIKHLTSFKMMSKSIYNVPASNEGHVILIVDENSLEVKLKKVFENEAQAISIYNNIEKVITGMEGVNTLLVSTKSLDLLAEAYPNYIGDCSSFIDILKEAMAH